MFSSQLPICFFFNSLLSSIVLPTYILLGVGPPHRKEIDPPLCSHLLSIPPQLGVGAHVPAPLPIHAEMLAALILCESYAGNRSSCEFMNSTILSCPEDTVLSDPWILQSLCPYFFSVPWAFGGEGWALWYRDLINDWWLTRVFCILTSYESHY